MKKATQEILEAFASKHKVKLMEKSEVGFGRPCVGFIKIHNYIDYNPYSKKDNKPIIELEDDRHYDILPKDAYHKHDCLAVLVDEDDGDYDKALDQLAQWVTELEKIGVEIVEFTTGAEGMQAIFTDPTGYALKLKK